MYLVYFVIKVVTCGKCGGDLVIAVTNYDVYEVRDRNIKVREAYR